MNSIQFEGGFFSPMKYKLNRFFDILCDFIVIYYLLTQVFMLSYSVGKFSNSKFTKRIFSNINKWTFNARFRIRMRVLIYSCSFYMRQTKVKTLAM